jgi:hypothetical protein
MLSFLADTMTLLVILNQPISQVNGPICNGGCLRIVGDHHDRLTILVAGGPEQSHDDLA